MKTYEATMTLGQIVADNPNLTGLFEQLGLDFCCGGKRTLEQACRAKGLDMNTVLRMLSAWEQTSPKAASEPRDWTAAPLAELCDHIVATHHEYLRRQLPRLAELTTKVASVHVAKHPELEGVRYTFACMKAELDEHMMKEERILFPAIKALDGGDASAGMHCGGINRPIAVMEHEHDSAGRALAELRRLTRDYAVPESGACSSYRAMLRELAELESDLHEHIHKENNILFPRALEAANLSPVG